MEATVSRQQRTEIDAMVRQPRPEGPRSVDELRAGFRAMMAEMIVPAGIRTQTATLGDRPAVLVEPADTPTAGTILYFHGGSYVVGSPETAMSLTGNLVTKTGFRAFSLDYRLAPEHPFPAAIEDGLSAYRALLDSGEDPSAILVEPTTAAASSSLTGRPGRCGSPTRSRSTRRRAARCRWSSPSASARTRGC